MAEPTFEEVYRQARREMGFEDAYRAARGAGPESPPMTSGRVGRIVGEELVRTPGRMLEGVRGAIETAKNPPMATVLPLTLPGGGTVVSRLGAIAAGSMLDNPQPTYAGNLGAAAKDVAIPAALEAAVPVLGKILRSTEWGRGFVNRSDARRFGQAVADVAPTLQPGTTATALQHTAEGAGLARLGAAKEATVQDIERRLAGGQLSTFTPSGEIPMPSLATSTQVSAGGPSRAVAPEPAAWLPSYTIPGHVSTDPLLHGPRAGSPVDVIYGAPTTAGVPRDMFVPGERAAVRVGPDPLLPQPPTGGAQAAAELYGGGATQLSNVPITVGRSTMSLREANAALSEIGDMLAGRRALDPRFKDVDLVALYGQIAQDIEAGIAQVAGPEALRQWQSAQAAYRAGRAILDLINRPGLFRQGQFTLAELQRVLKDPEVRASLAKSLGGNLATGENLAAYNRMVDAITRGAGAGMVDELAGKAPGLFSGRGSYGAWRVPVEVVRWLLPNASTQYVGRRPFTIPPALQAVLDVALQRAGGAGLEPGR